MSDLGESPPSRATQDQDERIVSQSWLKRQRSDEEQEVLSPRACRKKRIKRPGYSCERSTNLLPGGPYLQAWIEEDPLEHAEVVEVSDGENARPATRPGNRLGSRRARSGDRESEFRDSGGADREMVVQRPMRVENGLHATLDRTSKGTSDAEKARHEKDWKEVRISTSRMHAILLRQHHTNRSLNIPWDVTGTWIISSPEIETILEKFKVEAGPKASWMKGPFFLRIDFPGRIEADFDLMIRNLLCESYRFLKPGVPSPNDSTWCFECIDASPNENLVPSINRTDLDSNGCSITFTNPGGLTLRGVFSFDDTKNVSFQGEKIDDQLLYLRFDKDRTWITTDPGYLRDSLFVDDQFLDNDWPQDLW